MKNTRHDLKIYQAGWISRKPHHYLSWNEISSGALKLFLESTTPLQAAEWHSLPKIILLGK